MMTMTEFHVRICISQAHLHARAPFLSKAPSRQHTGSIHGGDPPRAQRVNNLTRSQEKPFSQWSGEARAQGKVARYVGSVLKPGHPFPGEGKG